MKKLYLKGVLLLVLTLLLGITSCKKDEFKNLSLSFSTSKIEVDEGGYVELKKYLVIQPSNLDTITVEWSSSDGSIATVTKNGEVEGIEGGAVTITASAYGKSASVEVVVKPLPVTAIKIPEAVATIHVNVPHRIEGVVITPEAVNPKRINWSCKEDDSKISFQYNTEDHSWYVTITEGGDYNVEASIGDIKASSVFTATVNPVKSLRLSEANIYLLSQGDDNRTAELTYEIEPENASYRDVEWSVTPSGIINFDNGKISTIDGKEGTVYVTIKHKAASPRDKSAEATCRVIVTQKVPVTFFTLTDKELSLDIGKDAYISVKEFQPVNGDVSAIKWSVDDKTMLWLYSDKGPNCKITAIGTRAGTATVTATAPNGYGWNVTVTVNKIKPQIAWDMPKNQIFFTGKTYSLPAARVVNKDATIKDIFYFVYEGSEGYRLSTDINITKTSDNKLKFTSSAISGCKDYRLVAICDDSEVAIPITLVASDFLQKNLNLDETNSAYYGTSPMERTFKPNTYLNTKNTVVRDLVRISPNKTTYYAIGSKENYDINKEYKELTYVFRPLASGKDITEALKFTLILYDYNKEAQKGVFEVNMRNSFLGYHYKVYDYYTPNHDAGMVNAGDVLPVRYAKKDWQFYAPSVEFSLLYYGAGDTQYLKSIKTIEAETYKNDEARTVEADVRAGEVIYVLYYP